MTTFVAIRNTYTKNNNVGNKLWKLLKNKCLKKKMQNIKYQSRIKRMCWSWSIVSTTLWMQASKMKHCKHNITKKNESNSKNIFKMNTM